MPRKLQIKVCGMKDPGNMEAVAALGPDFLGYIFHPSSPRYVGRKPDKALFKAPGDIRRVGVFVDEAPDTIRRLFQDGSIDMAQLHGSETPAVCLALRQEGLGVLKAIPANRIPESGYMDAFAGCVDFLLVDTPTPKHGGSGQKFDWSLLEGELPLPFFLSGGLSPGDAHEVLGLENGQLAGLDLNSRFETAPGLKDPRLLESFLQDIRNKKS